MTPMTAEQATVTVQRTFAAPPERVYRAWLEPELLRRWLTPFDDLARAEVEERVGGRYRVWHEKDGEPVGGFEAEVLELVPAERLVFKWGIVGPRRLEGPVYDSRLTLTFRATSEGGTELTLVHERLEALYADMPELAEQFEAGWALVLAKLAEVA
jgi:uncharacterized protein YndB with AHSA1/START domain